MTGSVFMLSRKKTFSALLRVNEEYKKGHFEKFGISNYTAEDVEEIVKIAKEKNYVLPTVYQENYSLVARGGEEKLFPVLRKHGISFYAYSPLAGSFLTGAVTKEIRTQRLDPSNIVGKMYSDMFCKDSFFQALDDLRAVGEQHGLTIPEIALRWLAHHSQLKKEYSDAIVIGGKTLSNIQNTLGWLDKPALPPTAQEQVEKISRSLLQDAPQYHF